MRAVDDLKTALLLSGTFAAAAVSTVPLMLDTLPPEARALPLPLPVFVAALALQIVIVYGLFAFAGLRLARAAGREAAPFLSSLWGRAAPVPARRGWGMGFVVGLGCGGLLVGLVRLIQRYAPETLPEMLHPPGVATALVASIAGALGEEILFRLFVLSVTLWVMPKNYSATVVAVVVNALLFGAAHAPGFIFLFGGWHEVPAVSWVWVIGLNGLCGIAFGVMFLRAGIGAAILAHFGTDLVWHAGSRLFQQ